MIYICLPAYNEEQSLDLLFSRLSILVKEKPTEYKIILVNDGSTDRTEEIAKKYQTNLPIEIVSHPENLGLGEAIKTALKTALKTASDSDIIVNLDADNTHDPFFIPELVKQTEPPSNSDIVIASRYQKNSKQIGVPLWRRLVSRIANLLFKLFLPIQNIKDYTCGYRAYRAHLVKLGFNAFGDKLIEAKGFACTDELLVKLSRFSEKISEIPFTLRYDLKKGKSKINFFKTAIATFKLIFKERCERKKMIPASPLSNALTNDYGYYLVFLAIYLLSLLIWHPWINSDGIVYYSQLRSLVIDKDLQLRNEYLHFYTMFTSGQGQVIQRIKSVSDYTPGHRPEELPNPNSGLTKTGHIPIQFSIGPAILWLPFFLLAHVFVVITNYFKFGWLTDGFSAPYVYLVTFATTVYGFIGLILSYIISTNFFSKKISFLATLTAWFSTSLIYYMYLVPSMAHTLSVFGLALVIYLWIKFRSALNLKKTILLGLATGFIGLIRWQNLLFFIIPALETIRKKQLIQLVVFLFAVSIGFLPQLIVWKIVFGDFLLIPQGSDFLNFWQPKILEVLFSTRHGLITWTPSIGLALLGLYFLKRRDSKLSFYLILFFLVQLYLVSIVKDWWAGSAFGQRRLLDILPIFILGLSAFYNEIVKKIRFSALAIISGLLILWNIGLVIQFALGLISHTDPVPLILIAKNQFLEVPIKIGKVVKYLFSFL